jgi:hypothetical protein
MAEDTPFNAVAASHAADHQPPLPPTTTREEDIVTAGQRKINLIWEYTQAVISIVVVLSNMVVAVWNGIMGRPIEVPVVLSSSLFLIVGFYFSRTNHAAIGGVGQKPEGVYTGR